MAQYAGDSRADRGAVVSLAIQISCDVGVAAGVCLSAVGVVRGPERRPGFSRSREHHHNERGEDDDTEMAMGYLDDRGGWAVLARGSERLGSNTNVGS